MPAVPTLAEPLCRVDERLVSAVDLVKQKGCSQ
jgi:hypothetical protein